MTETKEPILEMLWETSEATDALETRFGFSDSATAGRWVAAMLDEQWGVQVNTCSRIVISDRNALAWADTSSGQMIAKWSAASARFPRLAGLAQLTVWLDRTGLPVSAPVATLDGHLQVESNGVSLGLQRQIDGSLLDITDPGQVRMAGAVLAQMHHALAAYPDADRIPGLDPPSTPLAEKINGWLDSCPDHVPAAAQDALRRLVVEADPDPLPTQLVHGDYRSANILVAGRGIAAVIDFEEARFDHRIDELARSAVMLGTRYRAWGPVPPGVRAAFLDGYQSERRISAAEATWWDALVLWYSLLLTPAGEDPTGWGHAALDQLKELS